MYSYSGIIQAINGVSFAALLFLLASGFTLSFGLMRVVNMAHGAYYLVGGYIGLSITRYTGSFALGVIGGGLAVIPIGYLIDRYLIRRTGENHLAQVLLTVGIAFVMGDVALKIWGGDNLKVPTPIELRGAIRVARRHHLSDLPLRPHPVRRRGRPVALVPEPSVVDVPAAEQEIEIGLGTGHGRDLRTRWIGSVRRSGSQGCGEEERVDGSHGSSLPSRVAFDNGHFEPISIEPL